MPQAETPWFVALPDTGQAAEVARLVRERYPRVNEVPHPSGRPWLLGAWSRAQFMVGRSAGGVLAVIGEHGVAGGPALTVATVHDLDSLHRRVTGSVFRPMV
jgi:asparagine synthase (glutamine-hydrolysing)